MAQPETLTREISPPPKSRKKRNHVSSNITSPPSKLDDAENAPISPAAIEAGKAEVSDHLAHFTAHLATKSRSEPAAPRISIKVFEKLYQRNQHATGHHFVIHQHNHPIAGVHYDLRLQISASSTLSFALPYGLPGNPNSKRPGRMAIETRVHNLWNNLVESASHATGSLLIWDTGEYRILGHRHRRPPAPETDDDEDEDEDDDSASEKEAESVRLVRAFQSGHVRLRLQGVRLPRDYTVTLRLPAADVAAVRKRRRRGAEAGRSVATDSEDGGIASGGDGYGGGVAAASEDEGVEDARIRRDNAYAGATNDVGSVHQRRWFLMLDKASSGFVRAGSGGAWRRGDGGGGFEAFVVGGADVERSVVTGRSSAEVMEDEGVEGFVARKRWRPVVE